MYGTEAVSVLNTDLVHLSLKLQIWKRFNAWEFCGAIFTEVENLITRD
jgi:hypothetical protein